jgi:transcriptional regulator with XRE-family HTH domain
VSIESRIDLVEELKEKEFRDAYAAEQVKTGIPFQIRALRNQREWNQERLAKEARTSQAAISRIEDPNYGKLSLQTLFKLASAFDVALLVKFVPFSRLLPEMDDASQVGLSASKFSDDLKDIEEWAESAPENAEIITSRNFRIIHTKGQQHFPWVGPNRPELYLLPPPTQIIKAITNSISSSSNIADTA